MHENSDRTTPNHNLGSRGCPVDTPGYPNDDSEDPNGSEATAGDQATSGHPLDLRRFLEPRVAAKQLASDQPIAHDGKAGWAVERSTGRAIWIGGTPQWEVMNRRPGAPRDEPGLTDFPADGGLPAAAPGDAALADEARRSRRKRVQIGLKLSLEEGEELEAAAELFGVRRTTLARLLVVRGAREILGRSPDSRS